MDVKKMVEELAREAGINAKGTPCCTCDTYENAVSLAETLIEELAKQHCPDFTFTVLTIALARYQTILFNTQGQGQTLAHMVEIATVSAPMGTQSYELQNKLADWHNQINPRPEGS